ncbi:MAG: hypothetical protein Q8P27_01875 [Candidatus Peregrinibacteria bacterium]|nr:hypothetical protein [Candidatus Peregrinibacteria bacterium]
MFRKLFTLLALTSVIALAGCGGPSEEEERANFADMIAEISCETMEDVDGTFSDDDAQAIAVEYGFGDWSEQDLNDYIAGLTDEAHTEISDNAVAYINANCLSAYEDYGIDPSLMIELMLSADY